MLKKFDLSHCHFLITLPPEIGDLKNLEESIILGCEIGELKKLRVLRLGNCESLMSLPPEIKKLSSLQDVGLPSGINLVEFIEQGGMEGWTSLRSLCLSKNEGRPRLSDNEYLRICHHLPSWLVVLQLDDVVDSIDLLSRVELPPRIRSLRLYECFRIFFSSNESDKQSLVDLLRRNRYLGFIGSNFHKSELYSPLAGHYLDINESGRCLIEGGHPIPLSVWSIVLERVNQKLTRRRDLYHAEDEEHKICRRANAIYYLLHGPALAARDSLV
jgi:hypothetical protein